MDESGAVTITSLGSLVLIYKILSLLVGFGCVFLGYRLFERGVFKGGAGVRLQLAESGWKGVVRLDRGGPGLIFALFGAVVIGIALVRGFEARLATPAMTQVEQDQYSVFEQFGVAGETSLGDYVIAGELQSGPDDADGSADVEASGSAARVSDDPY